MSNLITIKDLHIGFRHGQEELTAVKDFSMTIKEGETMGLVGESGSGKSVTALSIIKLLPYPNAFHKKGQIFFNDQELLSADEKTLRGIRGNDIAMIFQEPTTSLNPLHSIDRQIKEVLLLHRNMDKKQAQQKADELLERIGIEARGSALPHELSGGQRQRVMIAMALANRPKLLIADEPTTALDVTIQAQILDLLKELQKETGMSLLLISHDLHLVRSMADRISVMEAGKLVECREREALFQKPKEEYTKKLLAAQPKGKAEKLPIKQEKLLEGKNINIRFPLGRKLFGGVSKHLHAIQNVSLHVRRGETLGIVGESGSGKTSLGMALLRLIKSEGEIIFHGQQISALKQKQLKPLRKRLQIVFQDPYGSLSPRMSIMQIIGEGLRVHEPHLSKQEHENRVLQALKDVDIYEKSASRYPHEFSGGQRQRIALARALVLEPECIMLDEPTSA
ncbi:MAG: ABC transporter ATP-binding protein, partial [Parvibaculales bacterium]